MLLGRRGTRQEPILWLQLLSSSPGRAVTATGGTDRFPMPPPYSGDLMYPTLVPRIAPADLSQLDPRTLDVLSKSAVPGAPASNIYITMAQHERLYRRWSVFSGALFYGELPARDRELVILRTALRADSIYEWAQHNLVAREFGLDTEEIERIAHPELAGWSPKETALLRACDELDIDTRISEGTWTKLRAQYTTQQLIEICLLPGFYRMLAGFLNSAQVAIEDEFSSARIVPFHRLT